MNNSPIQILLTNDDGIKSPGLWAAAEALSCLGYVTVAAPRDQWSGAGRSHPSHLDGRIHPANPQCPWKRLDCLRSRWHSCPNHRLRHPGNLPPQAGSGGFRDQLRRERWHRYHCFGYCRGSHRSSRLRDSRTGDIFANALQL